MKEIVVSRSAQADIDEVWVYHAERNVTTADKIVDEIGEQLDILTEFPNLGRVRPELRSDCRSLPVGNDILYYWVLPETVEILRVVHSTRRMTTLSEFPDAPEI